MVAGMYIYVYTSLKYHWILWLGVFRKIDELRAVVCFCSKFAEAAMAELTSFNTQKVADFRSMLINYVQLQMHLHRQVSINNQPSRNLK